MLDLIMADAHCLLQVCQRVFFFFKEKHTVPKEMNLEKLKDLGIGEVEALPCP